MFGLNTELIAKNITWKRTEQKKLECIYYANQSLTILSNSSYVMREMRCICAVHPAASEHTWALNCRSVTQHLGF